MIKINNVTFKYKNSSCGTLSNISLKIRKGECVLLTGKSGCGKTSILRMLNGLIPHFFSGNFEGNVLVDGLNIANTPLYQIAERVGTVYQNPRSQFFNIDTDGEIAFGIENLSYPKEELLKRMQTSIKDNHIEHLLGRNIFQLSGGEKQKIAFACVYAMEPEVYLLDEPSANLDAKGTNQLRERILALKKLGKTIIITEHRLYYLQDIVDRVVTLKEGRIVKDVPATSFFGMSEAERISLGLRVFDLNNAPFRNSEKEGKPILQMDQVCSGYKKKAVVHNISFAAKAGEVIGIIGHNGAGKSTFAETICGLNKVLKGNVLWNGKRASEKQRAKLGYMVFQDVDYQLFADSVENECSYGMKNVSENQIHNILKELKLLGLNQKHPATLSGGQKQRLAVAVSMVCNKQILIFDEPTSGLDLESMIRVTHLIELLSQSGKLVFVVTHDYELICKICSRVLVIDNGYLQQDIPLTSANRNKVADIFVCKGVKEHV